MGGAHLSVRERCWNNDASITTDDVFGNLGFFDLLGEGEGEPPVALAVTRELAAIAGPAVVSLQPEVLLDGDLEALAHRDQGDLHPVWTEGHGVGVKGDGEELGRGAGSLLPLLDALAVGSDRAHGEAHHVADELGLEPVVGAQPVVGGVVELDGALDGVVVEGDGGGVVVGGGDTSLLVEQRRLGFRLDVEHDSNGTCRHQVHVLTERDDRINKKGALLLSLKEEVSVRLLKERKVED